MLNSPSCLIFYDSAPKTKYFLTVLPKKKVVFLNMIQCYYLGLEARRNHPLYPYKFAIATGEAMYVGHFKNYNEAMIFGNEYEHVKGVIGQINSNFEGGQLSEEQHRVMLGFGWLPLVNKLEATWGKEFVPGDVRSAKNDVEMNLGLPPTVWPEILRCA